MLKKFTGAVMFGILLAAGGAFAEEPKKIQDNSFLIEEAYNQEDGVIQHIQTFQYMRPTRLPRRWPHRRRPTSSPTRSPC